MNDRKTPSEIERDFIDYLRQKRGPCPDDETLIAFHEQKLPADHAKRIETHLTLCTTCQDAIRVLQRFDECQSETLPEPPEWPDVSQRLRSRFHAFLEQQKPARPESTSTSFWNRIKNIALHPALAYLLIAALLYPAYRGLFGKPQVVTKIVPQKEIVTVEKPPVDIATVPRVELKAGIRAAGASPPSIRLSPEVPFFILAFFVPVSERPEFVYRVEIYDRGGELIARQAEARPQDRLGNFLLLCRRDLFSPGEYELRVEEVNRTTQAVRRTFRFSFVME